MKKMPHFRKQITKVSGIIYKKSFLIYSSTQFFSQV